MSLPGNWLSAESIQGLGRTGTMKGLRKITAIVILLVVFFLFRLVWDQSSSLSRPYNFLSRINCRADKAVAGYRRSFSLDLGAREDADVSDALATRKADVDDEILEQSLEILRSTPTGNAIAEDIDQKQIKIVFGNTRIEGANAIFVPQYFFGSSQIIVARQLKKEHAVVIAAVLAHEGTHAQMNSFLEPNSVEQEYKSYLAQAKVWQEASSKLSTSAQRRVGSSYDLSYENNYALEIAQVNKTDAFKRIEEDYHDVGIDLPRASR